MSFLFNPPSFSNRLMAHTYRLRKTVPPGTKIASIRSLHRTSPFAYSPRKDSQEKDDLKPNRMEYTKSGTDDEVARQEDAAYDPKKTDPQSEKETAGIGVSGDSSSSSSGGEGSSNDTNPLGVSPANPEVSKPNDPGADGPDASPRNQPSGKPKSTAKNKKVGSGPQ